MSGTVEKLYQEWLTKIYGRKDLTRNQKEEMRKAFYSGAFVALNLVGDYSNEFSEDIACTKIELVNQELTKKILEWSKP